MRTWLCCGRPAVDDPKASLKSVAPTANHSPSSPPPDRSSTNVAVVEPITAKASSPMAVTDHPAAEQVAREPVKPLAAVTVHKQQQDSSGILPNQVADSGAALAPATSKHSSTQPSKDDSLSKPTVTPAQGLDAISSLTSSVTFKSQSSLKPLPLPQLALTLQRLKHSLRGLLTTGDAQDDAAFERACKDIDHFLENQGPLLHKKLEEKFSGICSSWPKCLVDSSLFPPEGARPWQDLGGSWMARIWLDEIYLKERCPTAVETSYFIKLSPQLFSKVVPSLTGPTTKQKDLCLGSEQQLVVAANAIHAVVSFRQLLVEGKLAPDANGSLCMSQYLNLFSTTRVPHSNPPHDELVNYSPSHSNHIVLAIKGHFFEFDVVKADNSILSVSSLKRLVLAAIVRAEENTLSGKECKLGLLTTQRRSEWAKSRDDLIQLSESNRVNLDRLESAMFVVCLDDATPSSRIEETRVFWHGGSGSNRYFDKSLQLAVTANGLVGFTFEHSGFDGTVGVRLSEYVLQCKPSFEPGDQHETLENLRALVRPLAFQWSSQMDEHYENAVAHFQSMMEKHDLHVLDYNQFGKGKVKQFGVSPDAFAQLAIQLAWSCLRPDFQPNGKLERFRKPAGTYETIATRCFASGRTETMRSATPEALQFVDAMYDPQATKESRKAALLLAAETHVKRCKEAQSGQGIDRHLLGLRVMHDLDPEGNESVPAIFTNPDVQRSKTWVISIVPSFSSQIWHH